MTLLQATHGMRPIDPPYVSASVWLSEIIIEHYYMLFGKNLIAKLASANMSATWTASMLKDYTHNYIRLAGATNTLLAYVRICVDDGLVSSGSILCQNIVQTHLLITVYRVMLLIKYTQTTSVIASITPAREKPNAVCRDNKCIKPCGHSFEWRCKIFVW